MHYTYAQLQQYKADREYFSWFYPELQAIMAAHKGAPL